MKKNEVCFEEAQPSLQNGNSFKYYTSFKSNLSQIVAVMVKNLILLILGTALGFPTIIIPAVRQSKNDILQLTPGQLSWVGSLNSITVPIGCLISGPLMNSIGRKKAMQFVNLPFIIGFLVCNFSKSVVQLYAGLTLLGIAGGFLEAPVLSYVAEVTQPHLRGTLSTTSTMTLMVGMFLQFLFGIFISWRQLALVNIITPICALICLSFIPESPYWLIQKNRHEDSKKSLQWLRGWTTYENIAAEYNLIRNGIEKENEENVQNLESNMLSKFTKISFYWPFSLLILLFFISCFNGTMSLVTYSVLIFETLMVPVDSYYVTLILGVVQIIGTIICALAVHRLGKRRLGFITSVAVGICFLVVGIYTKILENKMGHSITELGLPSHGKNITLLLIGENLEDNQMGHWMSYIPVVFLIASSLLASSGIRLLPWILIGEVFSYEIRSTASGLAAACGYLFIFLTNKTYFDIISLFSLSGTFLFYSSISLIGTIIIYFILPETEGYSLNAISDHFSKTNKLPKKVNRKKELC